MDSGTSVVTHTEYTGRQYIPNCVGGPVRSYRPDLPTRIALVVLCRSDFE